MASSTKVWSNDNPPQVDDVDLNGFERENNFLISSSGQSLDTSDNTQTSQAVANYVAGADFYTCSGSANAYILSTSSVITGNFYSPTQYFDGMRIRFLPNISNTGTSTINVAGLGVVPLYRADGADLEANDLNPNLPVIATYITSGFRVLDIGNNTSASNIQNVVVGGSASTNPWQRQITLANAITPGSYQYLADRIYITSGVNTTAQLTYFQSTDAPPMSITKYFSANSFAFQVTTIQSSFPGGDEGVWVGYMVEGYDFVQLAQQNIVVSFVAKSTVPGIYSIALQNGDQTYSVVQTISLTTSYQLFVLIFPPSPSAGVWNYTNGIGLNLLIALSPSSYPTSTLNQWQNARLQTASGQANLVGTNGAIFNFDQLFIAPGSIFNGFNELDFASLNLKCKRYYQKRYGVGYYAGDSTLGNDGIGFAITNASPQVFVGYLETSLRSSVPNKSPYITFYDTNGVSGQFLHQGGAAPVTTTSISDKYTSFTCTHGGGFTPGGSITGYYTVDCELGII